MALSPTKILDKPPATPPQPRSRRVHARHSSLSRSPINLPIRTDSNVSACPRSPQSLSEQQPHRVLPRRSFYLENSLPVSGEKVPQSPQHSLTPRLRNSMDEVGLIFDDGDERLPPPEASPSQRYTNEADIVAISSPFRGANETRAAQAEVDVFDYSLASEDELGDYTLGNYSYEEDQRLSPVLPSDSISVAGLSHIGELSNPALAASYPTPLPAVLMRPPILSKKGAHQHRRQQSLDALTSIKAPVWTASPLESEIRFLSMQDSPNPSYMGGLNSSFEDDAVSDVDSDRATIMSGDEDEFQEAPLEGPMDDFDAKSSKDRKGQNWVSKMFFKKTYSSLGESKDEMGEKYDAKEAKQFNSQMSDMPDNEAAFSRLDPETIQRHSQMFNSGGLHNAITPRSGGPTSLIEELEIRKAGKKLQRQVFFREINEIERQRAEDSNKFVHPADMVQNVQPTLLQMQHMAEADYKTRVQWHKRAINKNYIQENATETLAQRRARLRAQKQNQGTDLQAQETLAQRRQRLKSQRMRQMEEIATGESSIGYTPETDRHMERTPDSITTIKPISEVY